jgi:hypothetical protein
LARRVSKTVHRNLGGLWVGLALLGHPSPVRYPVRKSIGAGVSRAGAKVELDPAPADRSGTESGASPPFPIACR